MHSPPPQQNINPTRLDHTVLQHVIRDRPIAKEIPEYIFAEQKGYMSQVIAWI